MAEYIERESLMQFPIRIDHYDKKHGNEHFVLGIESVLEYAESLPAADVVEVVRCKNCKHYRPYGKPVEDFDGRCWIIGHETDEMEFCSYGEAKMDGKGDIR